MLHAVGIDGDSLQDARFIGDIEGGDILLHLLLANESVV